MGRHKKPTAALVASGAFKKDPARAEGRGNDLDTIGELAPPPSTLSEAELKMWNNIVGYYPPGTLKSGHWLAVLTIAQLGAATIAGGIIAAERAQLKAYLAEMGLTLKSAANVQMPKAANNNPFAAL